MIVYIDQVITSNIVINYLFIKLITLMFKEKINILKMIIALIVSIISLGLFFVPSKYIYNLRYFVGIVIGAIAFIKKDYKTTIIQTVIYYLLNLSFIGTLVIFNIKNIVLLYISGLFICVLWIIESYKNIIIKNRKYEYNVSINNVKIKAYLDSGNKTYCDGIPVVFIKKKYQSNMYKYYKEICVNTIKGTEHINVYKGPPLIKGKNKYIVYYAFVESLEKDLILNYELGD